MISLTRRLARNAALVLAISLASGCGGSAAPAQEPSPQVEADPQPAPATPQTPAAAPTAAETTEPSDTPPPVKKDDPDNRKRQIYYRSTPEGLAVSIEGVEFTIKAEPQKLDNGGFGIKIKVQAESKDDGMHTLLSPKNGPLAIGGTIKRKKGGDPEPIVSKRDGEDEQFIAPGTPLEFVHDWPGKEGPFAWWGDEIELQVGLWGVATAGERRRPIMKLCIIKMVAMPNGKPVVMAPKI
jgi:hypothetical protein